MRQNEQDVFVCVREQEGTNVLYNYTQEYIEHHFLYPCVLKIIK